MKLEVLQLVLEVYIWSWRYSCVGGIYLEFEALQFMLEVYIWSWRHNSWCLRYIFGVGGITVCVGEIYLELESL